MKPVAYCLFETPLGTCGIAWTEGNSSSALYVVTGFQLPEATPRLTEARIAESSGGSAAESLPLIIDQVIQRVRRHLEGSAQDFRDVPVELGQVGLFARKVYDAARTIPAGKTITYGELANRLDQPHAARAVGRALGQNPIPLIIPCHRVLAANGQPGGFSAYGGRATKAKLLALEGATVNLCLELGA